MKSFNCSDFTGKILVFSVLATGNRCFGSWYVVAYKRWSHMEVCLLMKKIKSPEM